MESKLFDLQEVVQQDGTMARRKLILICQSGGEFVTSDDGSLSYTGGDAHALDINHDTRFDDLKLELSEMWNSDIKTMSIKYFLPGNRKTLITLSSDKDLRRMIDFHGIQASKTIVADSVNLITASTPATTTPAAAVATPVVDAAPVAAPFIIDTFSTAAPADATPTPTILGTAPSGTNSFSIVAANATVRSPTGVTPISTLVTSSPVNATVVDNVGKRKRTASWKVGISSPTIVAVADGQKEKRRTRSSKNEIQRPSIIPVADDVKQERHTTSWKVDINSPTTIAIADDVGLQRLIASWKDGITGVGQQFNNVHEFRDALQKYAIANRFVYKLKKNDSNRVSAKCKAECCSWRIHASWVPVARSFRIKKMNNSHTCGGDTGKSAHPTKYWLASIIKDKLQDTPRYKPKEIIRDICRDFGIELNYTQVWRGVDIARKELQGPYKEAYNQLPWFCEKLVETNPGSVAWLSTNDDSRFQRLFVSFHASIYGFQNGCRPLLFLDATSLKSKYHEILLAATAVDGDDGIFPVVFAVVDVENDDNWHWFLEQLKSVVSTSRSITFVSDRDKGLRKFVLEVFENAHHGYCISHLVENFKKNLKGPFRGDGKRSLAGIFLAAAHAPRLDEFRRCTERMKSVSSEAYNWVMQSEPEYWSNALFRGERYNQITLDILKSLNNWLMEVRELPITQKIDFIRSKMMELFHIRRDDSSRWSTKLTPSKEEKLLEEAQKAGSLRVLFSSDSLFEVHDDSINVVNIDQWDCSCQGWKITGLPCCHAIAVFNCTGRSVYGYCSRTFMTESFHLTYSESINPVPDIGKPLDKEAISETVQVHPPRTHRPPSQRKRKRTKSRQVIKRPLSCSRCKGSGHNRATCKESNTSSTLPLVSDIGKPVDKEAVPDTVQVHPPHTHRPPSQQKRKRTKSRQDQKATFFQ
ncbi:hypothetical protein HHK36_025839 [Tetracentron sinense]|uniref:SWIM-type domain-containing protein n=1 Tax=Tetracentron sinense TaxID=13715 RepID=A0A835D3X0_TETSI|nr:hypothetical protein HHK36_025839 [Tetracentron sinense]